MRFYRYENREFKVGEYITRDNSSMYAQDLSLIKQAYNNLIVSPEKIVYMYEDTRDDHFETYKFRYLLETDKFQIRYSDYSPMVAFLEKDSFGVTDKESKSYYNLFSKAYSGDKRAINLIYNLYDYGPSNKLEYITEKAKIIEVVEDEEDSQSLKDSNHTFKIDWIFIKNHMPDYSKSSKGLRLYHNTFNSNINNIIKEGLLPSRAKLYDNPGQVVWLSEKRALGNEYGGATVTFDIPFEELETMKEKGLARKVNNSEWTFYCQVPSKFISMIDYNLGSNLVSLKLSTLIDKLKEYGKNAWLIQLYFDHARGDLLNVSYEDLKQLIKIINSKCLDNLNLKDGGKHMKTERYKVKLADKGTDKYKVLVTETLETVVEVSAKDKDEAELIVEDMYKNEEVVLDAECLVDTDIRVLDNSLTDSVKVKDSSDIYEITLEGDFPREDSEDYEEFMQDVEDHNLEVTYEESTGGIAHCTFRGQLANILRFILEVYLGDLCKVHPDFYEIVEDIQKV